MTSTSMASGKSNVPSSGVRVSPLGLTIKLSGTHLSGSPAEAALTPPHRTIPITYGAPPRRDMVRCIRLDRTNRPSHFFLWSMISTGRMGACHQPHRQGLSLKQIEKHCQPATGSVSPPTQLREGRECVLHDYGAVRLWSCAHVRVPWIRAGGRTERRYCKP
jgi:hypothetical protein